MLMLGAMMSSAAIQPVLSYDISCVCTRPHGMNSEADHELTVNARTLRGGFRMVPNLVGFELCRCASSQSDMGLNITNIHEQICCGVSFRQPLLGNQISAKRSGSLLTSLSLIMG